MRYINRQASAKGWLLDLGAPWHALDEVLAAVYDGAISPRDAAVRLGLEPTHGCASYTVEDAIFDAAE